MSITVKVRATSLVAARKAVGAAFCGVAAAVFLAPVSVMVVNDAVAQGGLNCQQQNREGGANIDNCGDCLTGYQEFGNQCEVPTNCSISGQTPNDDNSACACPEDTSPINGECQSPATFCSNQSLSLRDELLTPANADNPSVEEAAAAYCRECPQGDNFERFAGKCELPKDCSVTSSTAGNNLYRGQFLDRANQSNECVCPDGQEILPNPDEFLLRANELNDVATGNLGAKVCAPPLPAYANGYSRAHCEFAGWGVTYGAVTLAAQGQQPQGGFHLVESCDIPVDFYADAMLTVLSTVTREKEIRTIGDPKGGAGSCILRHNTGADVAAAVGATGVRFCDDPALFGAAGLPSKPDGFNPESDSLQVVSTLTAENLSIRISFAKQPVSLAGAANSCPAGTELNPETNDCEFSAESCGKLNPPKFYDGAECVPFAACQAGTRATLNAGTNRCDCPAGQLAEDGACVSSCGAGRVVDDGACVSSCGAGRVVDDGACVFSCGAGRVVQNIGQLGVCVSSCFAGRVVQGGICVAPSVDSCGGLTPAQFYSAALSTCVPFVECAAPEVLNAGMNRCESVAACAAPSVLNAGTNRCDCPAPNVGKDGAETPGECVAASVEVCGGLFPAEVFVRSGTAEFCAPPSEAICGGLSPAKFYDSAAGACVAFADCQTGAILNDVANRCECAGAAVLDSAGTSCLCKSPNMGTPEECVAENGAQITTCQQQNREGGVSTTGCGDCLTGYQEFGNQCEVPTNCSISGQTPNDDNSACVCPEDNFPIAGSCQVPANFCAGQGLTLRDTFETLQNADNTNAEEAAAAYCRRCPQGDNFEKFAGRCQAVKDCSVTSNTAGNNLFRGQFLDRANQSNECVCPDGQEILPEPDEFLLRAKEQSEGPTDLGAKVCAPPFPDYANKYTSADCEFAGWEVKYGAVTLAAQGQQPQGGFHLVESCDIPVEFYAGAILTVLSTVTGETEIRTSGDPTDSADACILRHNMGADVAAAVGATNTRFCNDPAFFGAAGLPQKPLAFNARSDSLGVVSTLAAENLSIRISFAKQPVSLASAAPVSPVDPIDPVGPVDPISSCPTGAALNQETNNCEFSVESCGELDPPKFYDGAECAPFAACQAETRATLNAGTNRCDCPVGQLAEDGACVSFCGAGRVVDDGACVSSCGAGRVVDDGACVFSCGAGRVVQNIGQLGVCVSSCFAGRVVDDGVCVSSCSGGQFVQGGICAAASVEVCEGLTPAQFYSAALSTCVPVANCQGGTKLSTETNRCDCPADSVARGGVCIPESGDLGELSDKLLCGAFGGTVRTATGGGEVCSGMDANDTFCIMNSAVGFPCRGLFKHLRTCNLTHNRIALNPFFCGKICWGDKAVGESCVNNTAGKCAELDIDDLFKAASASDENCAALLIGEGAEVNVKSDNDWTPLHETARRSAPEVARLLLEGGADVNAADKDGRTPLYSAAFFNSTVVMSLLISRGADVHARRSGHGGTPLHVAAESDALQAAELLIASGARIDEPDNSGETPLHWAARHNAPVVAELLINENANVNAKDNDGWTPLDWAKSRQDADMQSLLAGRGGICGGNC